LVLLCKSLPKNNSTPICISVNRGPTRKTLSPMCISQMSYRKFFVNNIV
jgi:hypothetical protein